ncbi:MAG: hypothetical protein JWO36_2767 [Myxococcales bacterium]|nr:hypothetical protein [Myxococcales bacterium]
MERLHHAIVTQIQPATSLVRAEDNGDNDRYLRDFDF